MAPTNPFTSLFGKSPFKPLQEHAQQVAKAAAEVVQLLDALAAADEAALQESIDKIFKLEHKADEIKYGIFEHLPKSMFMPVDRRDLLDILRVQDQIADTAQDIAGLLSTRRLEVPDEMKEGAATLAKRCAEACALSAEIISELDELIETGFRGRQADMVNEMVQRLNRVESDTDQLAMDLVRTLFEKEDSLKPLSVIFWYDLIQKISGLADSAETVGNRLRLLIAR